MQNVPSLPGVQIGQEALGRPGLLMVDTSLILSQLSFCSSYYTFMTKNIPSVIPQQAPGSFAEWMLTPDALILAQVMVTLMTLILTMMAVLRRYTPRSASLRIPWSSGGVVDQCYELS